MECSARNLDTCSGAGGRVRVGLCKTNSKRNQGTGGGHLVDVESWKTRQMQPAVQEHGAVACAEDEPVTVHPRGAHRDRRPWNGRRAPRRAQRIRAAVQGGRWSTCEWRPWPGRALHRLRVQDRQQARSESILEKSLSDVPGEPLIFKTSALHLDMPCIPQPLAHVSSSGKCDRLRTSAYTARRPLPRQVQRGRKRLLHVGSILMMCCSGL